MAILEAAVDIDLAFEHYKLLLEILFDRCMAVASNRHLGGRSGKKLIPLATAKCFGRKSKVEFVDMPCFSIASNVANIWLQPQPLVRAKGCGKRLFANVLLEYRFFSRFAN